MHALFFSLALFGQAELGIPPAPASESPPAPRVETVDDLRHWLLARLIVDLSFDAQKTADARRLLDSMNEPQMKELVAYYKERAARRDQASKTQTESTDQQALDQARLDLQQTEAYRDHLKREYDRQIVQSLVTQNIVYHSSVSNQYLSYLANSPFSHSGNGSTPWGNAGRAYYFPGQGTSAIYSNTYNSSVVGYGYGMGFY